MRIGVYWRSFKTLGGGPRVAASIIDSLAKLGHEPVVFTNEYDVKLYPTLLNKEIHCARKNSLSGKPAGKIVDAINATFLLAKKVSDVDCLFLTGMYFASKIIKIISDTKIVLYVHAPVCIDWTLNPALRKVSKKVETRLYRSADYVLSNSKLTKNTLREHLKLDSEVLYPPIDTDFFAYNDKKETNVIVSVCRLHPKKRSELMISFFRKLGGNYRFILAGAIEERFKEYERQLIDIASQDKRVSVLFNPSDDEIKSLYQKATVFWYIYPKEEFGIPVAEAMSCGTPVVAFQGGGVNEIIANNRTGFLVSSEDELIRRTDFLMANRDVSYQMGMAARKLVEDMFSLDVLRKKINMILDAIFGRQDEFQRLNAC
jgi:glycosyltransferase involved in cell wall biosynthesis